jgi:hypothetical protein
MQRLLRATTAYRTIAADAGRGTASHAALVIFPDEAYLRALLKECAKAFFGAEEGSRTANLIDAESYSDCLFYPPAGGKLTAELAGALIDESLLRPVEGAKKLFVLDAFHNVTPLVQNKLLKSLEEPAEGVFFLLGATAEHAVLSTVLSRVKKLSVSPFSEAEIEGALNRNHGGKSGAQAVAAACGGIYSIAERLLEGGGEFALAERFLSGEDAALCRELGERKEKRAFLAAVRLLLRDMLFHRTGREQYAATGESAARLAEEYPAGAILAALSLTDAAERQIQFNANFAQALLTLAIGIRKEKEKWQKLS